VPQRVETAIRERLRIRSSKLCDDIIKEFAACAKGRTVSVWWACGSLNNQRKVCIHTHTNEDTVNLYKKEYLDYHKQKKGSVSGAQ